MKTSLLDQFILLETPQRGSKRWGFFVSSRAQNVYNRAKRHIDRRKSAPR
jgi:transcription-repair coupling factor (superfamily II helicase)